MINTEDDVGTVAFIHGVKSLNNGLMVASAAQIHSVVGWKVHFNTLLRTADVVVHSPDYVNLLPEFVRYFHSLMVRGLLQ